MLMTFSTVGLLGSALLIAGICCLLTLCLYAFIIIDTVRLPILLWVLKVLMTFGTVLGSALCLLYVVCSHFYVCMLLYCRIGYFYKFNLVTAHPI